MSFVADCAGSRMPLVFTNLFAATLWPQRLQVTYDPKIHTYEKAKTDAIKLYDAGEGRWGTDETSFVRILFSSPREHLVLVNDIYKKKYVSDLDEAVRSEFSGYSTEALVFYGACARHLRRVAPSNCRQCFLLAWRPAN